MLTKKQKELFEFLNKYILKNKIAPSFEEMKIAVNLKSKSGIHRLILRVFWYLFPRYQLDLILIYSISVTLR